MTRQAFITHIQEKQNTLGKHAATVRHARRSIFIATVTVPPLLSPAHLPEMTPRTPSARQREREEPLSFSAAAEPVSIAALAEPGQLAKARVGSFHWRCLDVVKAPL